MWHVETTHPTPKPRSNGRAPRARRLSGSPAVGVYRGMSRSRNRPQEVFVKRVIFAITVVAAAFAATTFATGPARQVETSSQGRAVADWSLIAQNAIVAWARSFQARRPSTWASSTRPSTTRWSPSRAATDPTRLTNRPAGHVAGGRRRHCGAPRARGRFRDQQVDLDWTCLRRLSGWDTGRGGENQWHRGW